MCIYKIEIKQNSNCIIILENYASAHSFYRFWEQDKYLNQRLKCSTTALPRQCERRSARHARDNRCSENRNGGHRLPVWAQEPSKCYQISCIHSLLIQSKNRHLCMFEKKSFKTIPPPHPPQKKGPMVAFEEDFEKNTNTSLQHSAQQPSLCRHFVGFIIIYFWSVLYHLSSFHHQK